jgi:glycosyltransferase involved in cell wall biosynthesis
VIKQNYKNIEYIIIDGNSNDKTLAVIKKYESNIDFWLSEPDHGVYYAMNKGITKACGEWIMFLNAGDMLSDNNVINDLFDGKSYDQIDIIYGDTQLWTNNVSKGKAPNLFNLTLKMPFCHQSVFYRNLVLKEERFNTNLKVLADNEQFLRIFVKGYRFEHVNRIVSRYSKPGLSLKSFSKAWKEKFAICRKYNRKILSLLFIYFLKSLGGRMLKKLFCHSRK